MSAQPLSETKKPTLLSIDDELDQIAKAFDALEDGGTESDILESLEAYFGNLLDRRDEKLDRYAAFITQRKAYAKMRTEEANRLRALAKVDENTAERLGAFLKGWMESKGAAKFETPHHKFAIQNNGGSTPVIVEVEPTQLPPQLQVVRVEADVAAIRTQLDQGIEVPGCRFGERGTHLRIR